MIGLRLERQTTSLDPGGRSSQGSRRAPARPRNSSERCHARLCRRRVRRSGRPRPRRAAAPAPSSGGRRARRRRPPTSCAAAAPTRAAPSCTGAAGCRTRARWRPSRRRPVAHDHRAVADVVAERQVVRDEEDAEPARLQVAEQVEHVDPRRGVEHRDDLVGDEQADVEQERPRDQHALELAAGELVRVLAEHVAGVEVDGLERRSSFARHSAAPCPGSTRCARSRRRGRP